MSAPGGLGTQSLLRGALLGWAAFTVVNTITLRWGTVVVDVAVTAVTGAMFGLARLRPSAQRAAAHGAIGASVVGLVLAANLSGGPDAIAWWYLVAVPMFAAHTTDGRGRILWLIVVLGALPLAVGNPLGLPTEFLPSTVDRVFGGVVLVLITALFGVVAADSAQRRLDDAMIVAELRQALLSTLSHEIRTPLHGMTGAATVLAGTRLSAEQRELVDMLRASSDALGDIVNNVLDAARLEAGSLDFARAPTDLAATLEDVVDLFAAQASTRGVDLALVLDGLDRHPVEVDGNRVRQIVANLVGNAVKFTTAGSIVVRGSARVEAGKVVVVVRVEDTGPGIPRERLHELFRPFVTLEGAGGRRDGAGLGLSLSRRLARELGGDLAAAPDRTRGACFLLTLRLDPVVGPGAPEPPTWTPIVLVEASEVYAEAARSLHRPPSASLLVVGSAAEAVPLLAENQAAILVIAESETVNATALSSLPADLRAAARTVLALPAVRFASGDPTGAFDAVTSRNLRRSRLDALTGHLAMARHLEAQRGPPRPAVGLSVAVVDDHPTNRRVLRALLESGGHLVFEYADAEEAMAALVEGSSPDLILCDLHMTGMDGLEFAHRAREGGAVGRFVLATASSVSAAEAALAGYDSVLTKPFAPGALEAELEQAQSHHGGGRPSVGSVPVVVLDEARWAAVLQLMRDDLAGLVADHAAHSRVHVSTVETSDDAWEVMRAAHTLASSSAMLGYAALAASSSELERQLPSLDDASRRAAGTRLGVLLEESLRQADRRLHPARPTEPAPRGSDGGVPHVARAAFEGQVSSQLLLQGLAEAIRGSPPETDRLLVDARNVLGIEADVGTAFWTWRQANAGQFRWVAVLTRNKLWSYLVGARGRTFGGVTRGFTDEAQAIRWLQDEPPAQP